MSENEATTTTPEQNRDHVQALGRGLEVLKLFGRERRPLSVTEVASLAGITRTAARRFVLTLEYMAICPTTAPPTPPAPRYSRSATPTS